MKTKKQYRESQELSEVESIMQTILLAICEEMKRHNESINNGLKRLSQLAENNNGENK